MIRELRELDPQKLINLMIFLSKTDFTKAYLPKGQTGLGIIFDIIHNSEAILNELIISISDANLETEDEVYNNLIEVFNCLSTK